jgi:hypothetical protein
MRIRILVLGLVYLFSFNMFISAQKIQKLEVKKYFRETTWAMSKDEVKKAESSEFIKEEKGSGAVIGLELLVYKDNIIGLDCFIAYFFAENKLVKGRYFIVEKHTNKSLYISDFVTIKNQLINKYGKPKKDDVSWLNDLYKDDPSDYGMAVSVGHLNYLTEWHLPITEIQLVLTGDNYKINLWVDYIAKAYKDLMNETIEKAKKGIW